MENKNLYLDILEWAYNNSANGFTEEELFKKFNLTGTEAGGWYLKVFRNSGNGNAVLIDDFCTREEISYWTLSPKGMSEAINYLNLKAAQKSGKRAEKIALVAIGVSIAVGLVQITIDICFR